MYPKLEVLVQHATLLDTSKHTNYSDELLQQLKWNMFNVDTNKYNICLYL